MIIDLQRRLSEVGRIRIGQQVKTGKGSRPTKLDTFRLTSPDRNRIDAAARLYGGKPQQWEAPAGPQWEVITTSSQLPVVVPPSDMAFTQWYELWSGGGCQRRCDGVTDSISEGPCLCDPDARECKIHTRLSVMLRDLPGLGVWRIDSSGYYAGVELQGAVEVVKLAAGRGQMLPAVLRLEQRMTKRVGEDTRRYAVPVLDVLVTPAQLLGGGDMLDAGALSIEPSQSGYASWDSDIVASDEPARTGPRQRLIPVPETVPQQPARTVKEQTEPPPKRKPRKNAAKAIPSTGLKPRTAAQAAQNAQQSDTNAAHEEGRDTCPDCGEWGGHRTGCSAVSDETADERTKLNRQMHALFRKAGIEKDRRDDRLAITRYVTKQHDIESSNDLPLPQLRSLAETLAQWDRDGVLDDKIGDLLDQAAIDQWKHAATRPTLGTRKANQQQEVQP